MAMENVADQMNAVLYDADGLTYVTTTSAELFVNAPGGTFKPPMVPMVCIKRHHDSDRVYMLPAAESAAILQDIAMIPDSLLGIAQLHVCDRRPAKRTRLDHDVHPIQPGAVS